MGGGGGGGGSQEVPITAQEQALSEVVSGQWERYKTVLRPIEDKWLQTLEKSPSDVSAITGQVSKGVGEKFGRDTLATERDLFAKGFRPGGGRFRAAVGGMGVNRAVSEGAAEARGGQAVRDTSLVNMQNAIKVGRGEAVESQRDMTTLAKEATSEAINKAYREEDRRDTIGSSVMSAAGMGLAGWRELSK